MDWPIALASAAGLIAAATAIGLIVRARTGRVSTVRARTGRARARAGDPGRSAEVRALGLAHDQLGDTATLVQFSTELCSQCPTTARALGWLASDYTGVSHVEIDLTHDRALAERFRVLQTPTTLVLDRAGGPVARINGAPRTGELRSLLDELTVATRT